MLQKIYYYAKRIHQLGIKKTISRIQFRIDKKIYKLYWKTQALKFQANHTWKKICSTNKIPTDFNVLFENLKNKKFIEKLLQDKLFNQIYSSNSEPNSKVNLDWHQKFEDAKNTFYQDIKINLNQKLNPKKLAPDIKDPWELSRLQHLLTLGQKYKTTLEPKLAKTFQEQIDDWIKNNPFLLGINWVCPMEVAIRTINLIYGFHNFKNSSTIPLAFWQKLICSLYDHAKYLENNWETSDKPNNHYLSDLLGYFYLCLFFEDLKYFEKEKQKILNKILNQFEKQVQSDGTCYEGSTNYHKLVTEIFLHFYLLCKTKNIILPETFELKIQKMIFFLQDCTDHSGNLVQIGDNDSGKILGEIMPFVSLDTRHFMAHSGRTVFQHLIFKNKKVIHKQILKQIQNNQPRLSRVIFEPNGEKNRIEEYKQTQFLLSHYPNFGLTIIKDENCHITFRHPTFLQTQPSGHFHQDALSITLSINGIQVLVDPGTYVYTANANWRNFLRSSKNHNTFYLKNSYKFDDLFQLKRNEQKDTAKIVENEKKIEIENYAPNLSGLKQHRKLTFLKQEQSLELQDWWQIKMSNDVNTNSNWSLIFHPDIMLEFANKSWLIKYKNRVGELTNGIIARLETNLEFKKTEGFYSRKYGQIEKCPKLQAVKKIDNQKNFIKLNSAKA